MVKVWRARETVIKMVAATKTIVSTSVLDDHFASGTAIESNVKNVTITEPEGGVEKIDLIGESSSGFQYAALDEKPFGLATITGTLVQPGDEVLETMGYGPAQGVPTGAGTHSRYQPGMHLTTRKRPTNVAILINLDDSTDEVSIVMNKSKITKLGDRKISGPDGHWEQDFEAVCLAEDFYVEFKD